MHGVVLRLKTEDEDAFERDFLQLKQYFHTAVGNSLLPASPQEDPISGLNLLRVETPCVEQNRWVPHWAGTAVKPACHTLHCTTLASSMRWSWRNPWTRSWCVLGRQCQMTQVLMLIILWISSKKLSQIRRRGCNCLFPEGKGVCTLQEVCSSLTKCSIRYATKLDQMVYVEKASQKLLHLGFLSFTCANIIVLRNWLLLEFSMDPNEMSTIKGIIWHAPFLVVQKSKCMRLASLACPSQLKGLWSYQQCSNKLTGLD